MVEAEADWRKSLHSVTMLGLSENIDTAGKNQMRTFVTGRGWEAAATLQGGYVLARAAQDPAAFELAIDGALDLIRTSATGQRCAPGTYPPNPPLTDEHRP